MYNPNVHSEKQRSGGISTFRIVREKVHIEFCKSNTPHFNLGLLISKYAKAQPAGWTDPSKRNRFFTKPLSKYKKDGMGSTTQPRGHGYMDNILKTIMNKGAGIKGHFVNHQGRGACITGLLECDIHPEMVTKRTGHRDVETMFGRCLKAIISSQQVAKKDRPLH